MLNCNTAMICVRAARFYLPLLCLVFWVALNASAQESSPPASSQQAAGFTAEFTSTLIFKDKGHTLLSGRIFASPPLVRFEPQPEEPDRAYNEVQLYDFEQKKMRRVFLDDRIYFQIELTEKARMKAMRDGWIPWKDLPTIKRRKIMLKKDFVNDHPCILYLQERRSEVPVDNQKTSVVSLEYSLVWEAIDLKGLPVRIIYFPPNQSIVVVDYKNMKLADLGPPLFNPPEGFLDLSPF
ncbi:MAG: hypothetical protein L0Y56_11965 [Nitrospira sp.]|nr:hypothetical protein [Nitrospira sp.]